MQWRKCFSRALALGACGMATTFAGAQTLQFDVNSLTATAAGWSGLTHTGTVVLSMDGNSSFNAILIDGSDQPGFNGVLMDFQGMIELDNGVVVGGSFFIELSSGATYTCAVPSGVGDVDTSAGATGPFTVDTLTMGGLFDNLVGGMTFGNVDVSMWDGFEPLSGSTLTFKLGPNAGGTDDDVDIDIFIFGEPGDMMDCKEHEPNDFCEEKQTFVGGECDYIQGMLEKRLVPGPQPDTWLCVVDKNGVQLASNDNGSTQGNGKASGVWSDDGDADGWADLLVNNGDGTRSLRLIVTGFPDGFDGNCNGFFQNAPHGQIGEFTVYISYRDAADMEIRVDTYVDEFVTGAEAFRLNFTAPAGSAAVHINIDNTTGREEICYDVDYMCFSGLEPLGAYCITVVGGLDYDCNPTDTQLCWIDKNCDVIGTDDDSGPAPGYSQLCVIADVNGNICVSVSGGGDDDCDGWVLDEPHGVCGTYSIQVRRASDMVAPAQPGCTPEQEAAMALAAQGDLNGDGLVNGDDLSRLLSNWGLATAP